MKILISNLKLTNQIAQISTFRYGISYNNEDAKL